MKKKLFSMVLVLVMIVCAVPCTFGASAAEASDWTPVNFDYIENTADGFTIPANGGVGREIVLWDGLLYEGKFSVNIKTSAITGGEGEMPGIFFGGQGIERATSERVDYTTMSYYRAYFDGNGKNLVIGAIHKGTWVSGFKTGRSVDLKAKLGQEQWKAAFDADTVKLTVSFSQSGAAIFWINDIEVLKIEVNGEAFQASASVVVRKDCVPYGGQIAYDNGAASVAGGASGFEVEGGLEFKTLNGKVEYDPNTYTLTAKEAKAFGYFTNRTVRNGKIVIVNRDLDGSGNGAIFGVYHTDEASKREGNGLSYYVADASKNRLCVWSGHVEDHHNSMTTTSGTAFATNNKKWIFGSNASGALSSVDFDLTGNVGSIVLNAKNTVTVTDAAPLAGGYYGIRIDTAGKNISYYVVNNEKEAMALEIVSADGALKSGDQGTMVVKTFPAGSVINSGDKIVLTGNGIQQSGDAIDNGDGTYTINYTATADSSSAVSLSVDNHVFGTLALDVDITEDVIAPGPEPENPGEGGDTTPDDGGNTPGGDVTPDDGGNTPGGDVTPDDEDIKAPNVENNTPSGNNAPANDDKDEKPSSLIWIIVAAAAAAIAAAVVIVIVIKKKKK